MDTVEKKGFESRRVTLRAKFFSLLVLVVWSLTALGQANVSQSVPAESVVGQMIRSWAESLVNNDTEGLSLYYLDPAAVNPWKQKLNRQRFTEANLITIHSIRPPSEPSFSGVPLCAEVRFTMEFRVVGEYRPFNETREWGLTAQNGYLQIAYERREKEPVISTTASAQETVFPQLGTDSTSLTATGEPLPQPAPVIPGLPPGVRPKPLPVATPTLNEKPVPKDQLINELWNQLLLKFKKAYELRNEKLYIKCFVKKPDEALDIFRNNVRGRGWIQVDRLEIDADSVKGNHVNSTFRFRYSLWGPGMKKGELVEVDCAAIRGGPGWRFSRYNDEVLAPPARAPGYYPTDSMIQWHVQPPKTSILSNILGGLPKPKL